MAVTSFSMKVEGLKELESALKELPKATARNTIRRALTAAAEPILSAAIAGAPRKTGTLKQEIIVSKIRFSKGEAGKAAFAAAMKRGASRAEAAQAAHEANAEAGSDSEIVSGIVEIGPTIRAFYAGFVEFGTGHSTAKPFMRPAYEANKFKALSLIQDLLKDEIDKAVARIAKKQARAIAQAKAAS